MAVHARGTGRHAHAHVLHARWPCFEDRAPLPPLPPCAYDPVGSADATGAIPAGIRPSPRPRGRRGQPARPWPAPLARAVSTSARARLCACKCVERPIAIQSTSSTYPVDYYQMCTVECCSKYLQRLNPSCFGNALRVLRSTQTCRGRTTSVPMPSYKHDRAIVLPSGSLLPPHLHT